MPTSVKHTALVITWPAILRACCAECVRVWHGVVERSCGVSVQMRVWLWMCVGAGSGQGYVVRVREKSERKCGILGPLCDQRD